MTILLKQIFNFIKMLNSETGTNQIAFGIVVGMILGFSPGISLQTLLVIFLLFIFRIQMGAAFLSSFFFVLLAFPLDPIFHMVGTWALEKPELQGIYTSLYQLPIIPFTRFNNSIVMGSGLVAFILSPVLFFLMRMLIQNYREKIVVKFEQTRFWKLVKATAFYQWYAKYEALSG